MIRIGISKMTIQAPCINLVLAMIAVATAVATAPMPLMKIFFRQ